MSLDKFADANVNKLLARMTLDEKISLLAGADWWTTAAVRRLGIPTVKCSDGPNGVRGRSHFKPTPATCIPCATALASTFDVALLEKVGGLLAQECDAKGASMILGPTVNIQRNPLNGRAFESFSEDPFLSGMMASGYINGLQSNGIGACIKHFVANDMEHERCSVDVIVSERALREIYLMPFMLAQIHAKPWAYMTSYSRVNGVHVSENVRLLQSLLREEWGFEGICVSDWYGTYSTSESIKAGVDLEMPGASMWRGQAVKFAHIAGKLSLEDIDKPALRMLKFLQKSVRARPDVVQRALADEQVVQDAAQRQLNRKIAAESIVLLKNDSQSLPIRSNIKTLAVVGPNAQQRTVSGGGSAYLLSSYVVTPLEGLTAAAEARGISVEHAPGCYGHKFLPMLDGWMTATDGSSGWTAKFYNTDSRSGAEPIAITVLPGSRLRINDEKPDGLAEEFYLELTAFVEAPHSGTYDFGLCVAGGRASLAVDGVDTIDNGFMKRQTPGSSFYGSGTIEETGCAKLVAGTKHKIDIFFTSVPAEQSDDEESSQPLLMLAALRVGCAPQINPEQAVDEALAVARRCDTVVAVIGTNMDIEGEGGDRPHLDLPGMTDLFITKLLQVRPDAIIVNQSGSAVALPWIGQATTFLQSWFGGNETGNAIADVVFGDVNPAGRMSMSFPYKIQHCPAHLNWASESGKVRYGEGLFVGYRGYHETDRDVMFAFGQGLSYSSFDWSAVECKLDNLCVTATLTVINTSSVAGADVVQLYVSDPVSTLRRPKQELKGFAKVYLQPGESQQVIIKLDKFALACYDDGASRWTAEKGEFIIKAATSSRLADERSRASVVLNETTVWTGL